MSANEKRELDLDECEKISGGNNDDDEEEEEEEPCPDFDENLNVSCGCCHSRDVKLLFDSEDVKRYYCNNCKRVLIWTSNEYDWFYR